MLPLAINLNDPGTGLESTILGLFVVFAAICIVIFIRYRAGYTGFPKPLRDTKGDWLGAKSSADLHTLRLPASTDFTSQAVHDRIDALLDTEYTRDRPTITGALRSGQAAIADAWDPILSPIPRTARRLFSIAGWLLAFGLLAVSTNTVTGALDTGGGALNPTTWPSLAVTESQAVLTQLATLLSTVPGVEIAWALLLTIGILLYESLYHDWLLSGAILTAAASILTVLHQRFDATERDPIHLPSIRFVGLGAVGTITGGWLATLIAIGIGRRLGTADTGVLFGTTIASLLIGAALTSIGFFVVYRRGRIVTTWRQFRAAGPIDTLYAVIRVLALVFAVVVAPLIPIYVLVTITKLPTLIVAWYQSGILVKLATIIAAGGVLAVLAKSAAAVLTDIRKAVTEAMARGAIRAALLTQGLPFLMMFFAYALFYGFIGDSTLSSILISAGLALLVGFIVQRLVVLLRKARYRASYWDGDTTPAGRALIEAARLTNRRGDTQYYIRVNGEHELLHEDRDSVVDAAARVAGGLCGTGDAPSTVAEWHAQFAFKSGIDDIEETETKLRERLRRTVVTGLREQNPRSRSWWHSKLDEFPESVREERVRELLNSKVVELRDGYVYLRNDIYSQ